VISRLSSGVNRTIGTTHSLTINLGRERGFIEFSPDEDTDLFQFGRAPTNDFVINGVSTQQGPTMSRYSFRIICKRSPPYTCRIVAGGFDISNQLFVGEGALTWGFPYRDGFVTNGVRLRKDESQWIEVSCRGNVYSRRPAFNVRGEEMSEIENSLENGTIISISGINMMWLSGDHGSRMSTTWDKEQLQEELNKKRIQCPVQLSTIRFGVLEATNHEAQPWVYPRCGHVHGFNPNLFKEGKCTICRQQGPYRELKIETNDILKIFSSDKPTHVFNPCAHAIDLDGAIFWSRIAQPSHDDPVFYEVTMTACPFCRTPLNPINPYSKLIYQTET